MLRNQAKESINYNFIKNTKHQTRINDNTSQCLTCERKCKITKGKAGYCQTRYNFEGEIYSIVYGCNAGLSVNPIEMKPFFHFHPGSVALTLGTYGCNFDCFWCQNHHISHPSNPVIEIIKDSEKFISPENFIKMALRKKCRGTSISFNEPTLLFEYSLEVFNLARKNGLYNTFVTNGYMTTEVIKDLVESGLDAINIDIKGDYKMVKNYCGADVNKVWRNAKLAKDLGIHVEITTLLIKKLNSDKSIIREIAKRIANDLDEYTPFHITRFFPQYKSQKYGYFTSTPTDIMKDTYKVAVDIGLKNVYLGNIQNSEYANTTCPRCLKVVIKRTPIGIEELMTDLQGKCNYCGFKIHIA